MNSADLPPLPVPALLIKIVILLHSKLELMLVRRMVEEPSRKAQRIHSVDILYIY